MVKNKLRSLIFYLMGISMFSMAFAQKTPSYPPRVEAAIAQSPFPKEDWLQLLNGYKKNNIEKYEAACFLLSNAPLHHQAYLVEKVDSAMLQWLKSADLQYYNLVKHRNDTALFNPHFNVDILARADQAYRKTTEAKQFHLPQVKFGDYNDIRLLSPTFIRQQIEHAFAVRERNPFTQRLRFHDFLHYVLPYRSMENTSVEAASSYAEIYEKPEFGLSFSMKKESANY